MNGTLFGESLWDCGSHVIAVRLDDYPIRQCIHEQVTLQRDEDQGELNLDSTQRPLQGAFLIPPVLPVVLIRGLIAPSLAPVRSVTRSRRSAKGSSKPSLNPRIFLVAVRLGGQRIAVTPCDSDSELIA